MVVSCNNSDNFPEMSALRFLVENDILTSFSVVCGCYFPPEKKEPGGSIGCTRQSCNWVVSQCELHGKWGWNVVGGGNCRLHGTTDAVDQWFRTTGNSVVRLIVVSVAAAWHRRAVSQGHGSDIKHSKNAAGDGRKTGCLIAVWSEANRSPVFINEFLIW